MAKNTQAATEETAVTEATSADAPAAEGTTEEKPKRQPPVREPKFKGDMIITMLADKDGNPYSKENNPKRAGSKSGERFALYVNGMSVDQAVAAGLTRADLQHDVDKKFISIS